MNKKINFEIILTLFFIGIEIFEKDMSTSKEQGFTFRINCGDRIFHVMVESSYDRKNWITALRKSVETAKEMNSNVNIKFYYYKLRINNKKFNKKKVK